MLKLDLEEIYIKKSVNEELHLRKPGVPACNPSDCGRSLRARGPDPSLG